MTKVERHKELCLELNQIYEKKNHDYGDSFHVTWLEEGYSMSRIRLSDKLNRFKTLSRANVDAKVSDETIRDTLMDLANYAIMTALEMEDVNYDEEKTEPDISADDSQTIKVRMDPYEISPKRIGELFEHAFPQYGYVKNVRFEADKVSSGAILYIIQTELNDLWKCILIPDSISSKEYTVKFERIK